MRKCYAAAVAVVAIVALPALILQPSLSIVSANSMQPSLIPGDVVLCANTLSIRHGDIVILRGAIEGPDMVKRVFGLPNDHIVFKNREFYVNGENAKREYLGKLPLSSITDLAYSQDLFGRKFEIYESYFDFRQSVDLELKDEEYFVVGDNRDFSVDSREFGPVKRRDVICRVVSILGSQSNEGFNFERRKVF